MVARSRKADFVRKMIKKSINGTADLSRLSKAERDLLLGRACGEMVDLDLASNKTSQLSNFANTNRRDYVEYNEK